MKIMTSYFYQIRNFIPNMIPLSTAVWDPKWYHQNKNQKFHFIDKNGVINGLRAEPFMPGEECEGECYGPETCSINNPHICNFLRHYRHQLDRLNYNEIITRFERLGNFLKNELNFKEEPIMVLIVHEAYTNPCSEREVIQEWFKSHEYPIQEFIFGEDPRRSGMGLQNP